MGTYANSATALKSGEAAKRSGKPAESNPFPDGPLRRTWMVGWLTTETEGNGHG